MGGANNKYACMDGKTANIKIPTKFDVNTCAELNDEVIIAMWPGYHSTRVICSRSKTKPVLGVSIKSSLDSIQNGKIGTDKKSKDDKKEKTKTKITDPVQAKKIARENYTKVMLRRKKNKEWSEWFVHLQKQCPDQP